MEDRSIVAFLEILKLNDEDAYRHSLDVANLVALCLEKMSEIYSEEDCVEITKGALIHDIGKAFLPFGIQHASFKLDTYTKEIMNTHPLLGYIAIKDANMSDIVKNIVLLHHETADKQGYPVNLETQRPYEIEEIPEYVWIVAYADKFNAMTKNRKFQVSKSYSEAWDELNNMRISGILPYKYAGYFHNVIQELDLFG